MKNTYHIDNKNNIVYIDVKHRNHKYVFPLRRTNEKKEDDVLC